MTLREMLIESIAQFEIDSGTIPTSVMFENVSDVELLKMYRNNVWDEAYTDGHVEGYANGLNDAREENRKLDLKIRFN